MIFMEFRRGMINILSNSVFTLEALPVVIMTVMRSPPESSRPPSSIFILKI